MLRERPELQSALSHVLKLAVKERVQLRKFKQYGGRSLYSMPKSWSEMVEKVRPKLTKAELTHAVERTTYHPEFRVAARQAIHRAARSHLSHYDPVAVKVRRAILSSPTYKNRNMDPPLFKLLDEFLSSNTMDLNPLFAEVLFVATKKKMPNLLLDILRFDRFKYLVVMNSHTASDIFRFLADSGRGVQLHRILAAAVKDQYVGKSTFKAIGWALHVGLELRDGKFLSPFVVDPTLYQHIDGALFQEALLVASQTENGVIAQVLMTGKWQEFPEHIYYSLLAAVSHDYHGLINLIIGDSHPQLKNAFYAALQSPKDKTFDLTLLHRTLEGFLWRHWSIDALMERVLFEAVAVHDTELIMRLLTGWKTRYFLRLSQRGQSMAFQALALLGEGKQVHVLLSQIPMSVRKVAQPPYLEAAIQAGIRESNPAYLTSLMFERDGKSGTPLVPLSMQASLLRALKEETLFELTLIAGSSSDRNLVSLMNTMLFETRPVLVYYVLLSALSEGHLQVSSSILTLRPMIDWLQKTGKLGLVLSVLPTEWIQEMKELYSAESSPRRPPPLEIESALFNRRTHGFILAPIDKLIAYTRSKWAVNAPVSPPHSGPLPTLPDTSPHSGPLRTVPDTPRIQAPSSPRPQLNPPKSPAPSSAQVERLSHIVPGMKPFVHHGTPSQWINVGELLNMYVVGNGALRRIV